MAEQLSLNVVLYRTGQYRLLNAEMNWHCHCSEVRRDGEIVRIVSSGRIPAIVHLCDLKTPDRLDQYRRDRLFYERPETGRSSTEKVLGHQSAGRTNARVCVYTCLMGSTEMLNEQPLAAGSSVPFICLTDRADRRSQSWQIRSVSPLFEMDSVRSARAVKLRPHHYLPDFDLSLYSDNSVVLRKLPEDIIAEHASKSAFTLFHHSFRETVLDEFLAVSSDGLDDPSRIFEQLNHYALCYPEVLQEQPYWTGILLRDHSDLALRDALELWFAHVQRYSRRDQLSLNFVLCRSEIRPNLLAMDNHHSSYHSWPHKSPGQPAGRYHNPIFAYAPLSARVRELGKEVDSYRQGTDAKIATLLEENQRATESILELTRKLREAEKLWNSDAKT